MESQCGSLTTYILGMQSALIEQLYQLTAACYDCTL